MSPSRTALIEETSSAGDRLDLAPNTVFVHTGCMQHTTSTSGWSRIGTAHWRLPELEGVAFLADGRIVAVSNDGKVSIISDAGDVVASFAFDASMCGTVAPHPTRPMVAVGMKTTRPEVVLLDLESDARVVLGGHQGDRSPDVVWSADGSHILTGDDEGTVRLFTSDGKRVASHGFKPFTITGVALVSTSIFAAPGMSLYRIDIASGERTRLVGNGGPLAVSADGSRIACAPYNADKNRGAITLYGPDGTLSGLCGPLKEMGTAQPNAVAFTPNGLLIGAYDDGVLRLWEPATGKHLGNLDAQGQPLVAIDVSADGARAVAGADDGSIVIWDLAHKQPIARSQMPSGSVRALALGGGQLHTVHGAAARLNGDTNALPSTTVITHWDAATGARLSEHREDDRTYYTAAVSADGDIALTSFASVAVVSHAGKRHTISLKQAESLHRASIRNAIPIDATTIAFADGGLSTIATASGDATPLAGKGEAYTLALSSNRAWAIASGYDKTMTLFELGRTNAAVKTWKGVSARTRSYAVSPSGQTVLTGEYGVIRQWSAKKATPIATWPLPKSQPSIVAMVLDDEVNALTLSSNGIVARWDIASGTMLAAIALPDEATRGLVSFAKVLATGDGRLAVGCADGSLWLHALSFSGAPQATHARELPFAISPSYAEVSAGSFGVDDFDDHLGIRISYAKKIAVADKATLQTLYDGWAERLRRATYGSYGYATEEEALADGHPAVRIAPLSVSGKTATGGVSRASETVTAVTWLVDELAKLSGISSVALGKDV